LTDSMLSRFMSGILFTGIGKVSVTLLGIIGVMITTRILPPEEVGAFVLMITISLFLGEITNLGLNFSVVKLVAGEEDEENKRKIINTALYFRILTIIAASVLAIVAAPALFALFNMTVSPNVLLFLPVMVALEAMGKLLAAIYQGVFKFKLIGAVNILSSIVNFAAIVILVFVLRQGIMGLIYAKLLSRILSFVPAFFVAKIDLRREFDLQMLKQMLGVGFPAQVIYIMSFIFQRADTFLIGILLGPVQVAFYEVGRRIPDSLVDSYEAFVQVYLPFGSKLYESGERAKMAKMLNTSLRWISFATLCAALIAFLFGGEIMSFIFSETYASSAIVFAWLMVGVTFILIDSTLGYTLMSAGEAKRIPFINFIMTIVSFTSYFVLIPQWGMLGAAMAMLLAIAVINPLSVLYIRRKNIAVEMGSYLKPMLIFACFVLILPSISLTSFTDKTLWFGAFLLVNMLVGVITLNDISILQRLMRPLFERYMRRVPSVEPSKS
jgi:O-antigen/teichoic acid export membrane protein